MPGRRNYKRRGRGGSRRRNKNKKLTVYTRKGSKAQARQIWRNQSQISSLAKRMKETYTTNYYAMAGHKGAIEYPGYIFPLIDPGSLQPIFSTQNGGANSYGTHAKLNWLDLQGIVQIEQGDAVVSVDLFLMRMREDAAEQVKADLGGALIPNLVELDTLPPFNGTYNGTFYHNSGNATLEGRQFTMMNPKAFEVVQKRSFLVGDVPYSQVFSSEPAEVSNIKDANKPFHFRIPYPIKLSNPVGVLPNSVSQSWKTMAAAEVPAHKQLFLFASVNAVENTAVFVDWSLVASVNEPN